MKDKAAAKTRIMVLDDDKSILTAFACLMPSLSDTYDVDYRLKPTEALDEIVREPAKYQLIMTDIRMPGMDGLQFAESVRKIAPNLPIVFMTAYTSEDFHKKAIKFQKVVYLEKPFHLETILKETIPTLLG